MTTIIISPYSKKMRNGEKNPKNYPNWKEVVAALQEEGHRVIQVGVFGEEEIGADETKLNLSLKKLRELLEESDGWISVDNFFNHFATFYKKRGVVIFSRSDPKIFGYPENINLLKDRKYLRPNQFELWEQDQFNGDAFVSSAEVVAAVKKLLDEANQAVLATSLTSTADQSAAMFQDSLSRRAAASSQ